MVEPAKKRRPGHHTQWAAQFAVASELCKQEYEVALTMGNHPTADIMVYSPKGKSFVIDVKGLYKKNFWAVRKKPENEDVYYVLAFVPKGKENRFFIMTQREINEAIDAEHARAKVAADARGAEKNWADRFPGLKWTVAKSFENQWDKLPD